ncbi:MAG TPA: hypothetical protein VEQ63_05760, partial [Bryobacteraceae bacterium]|nr:hypothetical protein [Bryobacteraceae bacterium]
SLSVTLTGISTKFAQGVTQARFGPGISVGGAGSGQFGPITVVDATTATASLVIDPAASPGTRTADIQCIDTLSLPNGFAVLGPSIVISPPNGSQGQTQSVTITGSNTSFAQGQTSVDFGSGITVSSVVVTGPGALTATLSIAAGASPGARTVSVTTGAQTVTLTNGFTVAPASVSTGQPLTCNLSAGVPPLLRAEGLTELTGDIVLICSGGVAGEARTVNLQLFLNTTITSRPVAGDTSEALLIVDELGGTPAFYLAQRTREENSILWPGVTIVSPGSGQRVLRITNVRANAALLGPSSTLIPTQVLAFLSASPSQSLALSSSQVTVGYIQRGLELGVVDCAGETAGAVSFAQCVAQNNNGSQNLLSASGPGAMQFGMRFREGFPTAFKPRVAPGQVPSVIGRVYNSESGLVQVDPSLPYSVGGADSGTRLVARFQNIPAGVRLFVTTQPTMASSSGSAAVLVQTDSNGGGSAGTVLPVASTTSLVCNRGSVEVPAAEIQVIGGSAIAVWEITVADPSQLESLVFGIAVAYTPDLPNRTPAVGTTTVSGSFGPFYSATGASGRGSAAYPVPRFVDLPQRSEAFIVNACVTNLLFPFVTNQAGFDTGIAIANTSADYLANPSQRQQSGTCRISYFGSAAGGTVAPAAQITDAVIPAGRTLTFVLSSGGNFGINGTPGFQGYLFAQCDFQFAHGFAFITDGPVGAARVAEGYLALIVDGGSPVSRTSQPRESLSH